MFFLFNYKKRKYRQSKSSEQIRKTWQIMILAKSEIGTQKNDKHNGQRKERKRCLNSSQTLNYRHQFCNVHHTNDTGTPSDSEHEVKASRTSSSSSSRQFYPLLIHELDVHINPEGSLKKQFYHVFLFLNRMGRIFSFFFFKSCLLHFKRILKLAKRVAI